MDITAGEAALAVGVLNLFGVIVVTAITTITKRFAREANDAVNHSKDTGTPRIYDMVLSNHMKADALAENVEEIVEWKRSYKDSPWETGDGVKKWLDSHDEQHDEILRRLSVTEEEIQFSNSD